MNVKNSKSSHHQAQIEQYDNPPKTNYKSGYSVEHQRILHYIGTWVSGTGVDTFVLHLAVAQQNLGLKPSVAGYQDNREEFWGSLQDHGFPIYPYQKPDSSKGPWWIPRKIKTALYFAKRILGIIQFILKNRIDVIHLHTVAVSSIEAYIAAILTRTTIVATHHATIQYIRHSWSKLTDINLILEKWFCRFIVCPYNKAADEMRALVVKEENLYIVPFCADEKKFCGTIEMPQPGGEFRLMTISRLVPGKGHKELLDALALLRSEYPQLRLTIAGDGPTRTEIELQIKRLGLHDMVTMAGHVHNSQMPQLMLKSHVVVLPSYMMGETYPVCLLEAMCLGMPCIGSRWFGIPDIITDGKTGFIVEPREVKGLAEAIKKLAGDLSFFAEASKAAQEQALREFTGIAVAQKYLALYEKAEEEA